jgi:hypothetical protein
MITNKEGIFIERSIDHFSEDKLIITDYRLSSGYIMHSEFDVYSINPSQFGSNYNNTVFLLDAIYYDTNSDNMSLAYYTFKENYDHPDLYIVYSEKYLDSNIGISGGPLIYKEMSYDNLKMTNQVNGSNKIYDNGEVTLFNFHPKL